MIEELLPGVFRIEVPLPNNPLKALNCWVLKGPERNLIIDTGMNRDECVSALNAGLAELEVDLNTTDLVITHMHADHSGLVSELATPTSTVYAHQPDADIINQSAAWNFWSDQEEYARASGFPPDQVHDALEKHPGFKYSTKNQVAFHLLNENDAVDVGAYHFRCVETPGHTKGHICLYEPARKILFSGDHVLRDITPNISLWSDDANPLGDYLKSLDKIAQLEVAVVLPGHRAVFNDCHERIIELQEHHRERADEILTILEGGAMNSYQIASRMTWDITGPWEDFPVSQKWFAIGEAIAHLKYLEVEGEVAKETRAGEILFMGR